MNHFLFDIGTQWVLQIQSWGAWLRAPMYFFSFLGEETFFLLAMPLIYWCYDQRAGLRIGLALLTAGALNNAFKLALHTPRPYWYSGKVQALKLHASFGAPSGHAQTAAAVWSMAAHEWRKRSGWIIAITVIFFIGLSRIYLGVHFVHDVVLGWILGALIFWLIFKIWDQCESCWQKLSPTRQTLSLFALSALYVFVNWIPWRALSAWQMPASWQANILQWTDVLPNPVSINDSLSSAGTLFGLGLGAIWLSRRGGDESAASARQLILRYLLGMAGLLVIWYGLGKVFPRTQDFVGFALRYFRYALLGFWISGLAPRIFQKLGLR